jgi:hypothetical protein
MADLFISYSQADVDTAFGLVSCLEQAGFSCWIAPRDIEPAADWAEEIIEGISGAKMLILVFSAHSNQSAQVRREVERAVHKELPILPFRVEAIRPSKSLEYFLSAQHWMDAFPPPLEAHYARLCAHLQAHLAAGEPRRANDAPRNEVFQAVDLRRFERQLAHYIGPLANHLVKQAALRASNADELIARVALEIDSVHDRQRFVASCRQGPAQKSS